MIDESKTLNKIKKFVTEEYNHLPNKGAVIVKSVGSGYVVNGVEVKPNDNSWYVIKDKTIITVLRQRRLAILAAALAAKRKYNDISSVTVIDRQLDIYLEDQNYFRIRLKNNLENDVAADRLSRVDGELDLLSQQIHLLEKSVALA
jgi:hypothetical protein